MEHTYTVALAGNPNVGKSTVFNRLTGLRQHTGNWPGKTVERAEGYFSQAGSGSGWWICRGPILWRRIRRRRKWPGRFCRAGRRMPSLW